MRWLAVYFSSLWQIKNAFVGGAHGGVITLRLECAQDMQRESAAWVCAARKRRDRHDDVDTSLVPSLLRKQIDVEITAGKVL